MIPLEKWISLFALDGFVDSVLRLDTVIVVIIILENVTCQYGLFNPTYLHALYAPFNTPIVYPFRVVISHVRTLLYWLSEFVECVSLHNNGQAVPLYSNDRPS